jgi:hypothetical protein
MFKRFVSSSRVFPVSAAAKYLRYPDLQFSTAGKKRLRFLLLMGRVLCGTLLAVNNIYFKSVEYQIRAYVVPEILCLNSERVSLTPSGGSIRLFFLFYL